VVVVPCDVYNMAPAMMAAIRSRRAAMAETWRRSMLCAAVMLLMAPQERER